MTRCFGSGFFNPDRYLYRLAAWGAHRNAWGTHGERMGTHGERMGTHGECVGHA